MTLQQGYAVGEWDDDMLTNVRPFPRKNMDPEIEDYISFQKSSVFDALTPEESPSIPTPTRKPICFIECSKRLFSFLLGFLWLSSWVQQTFATEEINLFNLGTRGVTFMGAGTGNSMGWSVSSAGDVNGDGLDDMVMGAPGFSSSAGIAYVILGNHHPASKNFSNPEDGSWIPFIAAGASYNTGYTVSSAGDVNGDGLGDILIGAPSAGLAYLVLGHRNFTSISSRITFSGRYFTGYSVSGAGDVNGDGYDDMVIGAPRYSSSSGPGIVYVVFGGLDVSDISFLNSAGEGSRWIFFTNAESDYNMGWSVSGAGDFNGDGLADIVIGAPGSSRGIVYVVLGNHSLSSKNVSNPEDGSWVTFIGGNSAGSSVSSAGDVNGDGLADIVFGAPSINTAYLLLGNPHPTSKNVSNPEDGSWVTFIGGNSAGSSVSSAGDVNGDGLADIVMGAPSINTAYLVLGNPHPTSKNVSNPADGSCTTFIGGNSAGYSVSSAGDVNGDGLDDILIGAQAFSSYKGMTSLVYGEASPTSQPSSAPSQPTSQPSSAPSQPSGQPSSHPSRQPSVQPRAFSL